MRGVQILGEVDESWKGLPACYARFCPLVSRVGGGTVCVPGYWVRSRAGSEPPWICLPCIQVVSERGRQFVSASKGENGLLTPVSYKV